MTRRRGQSTVELALMLPLITLLIAGTLQVGVLISDQIDLNQAAYEGGLWAVANPSTATADSGGVPGTISQHIMSQLCGTKTAPPSTDGTRFCTHTSGVPDIRVSTASRVSSLARGPSLPLVTDAYADACNPWKLGIGPGAGATIVAGSSQAISVTLTITPGPDNDPVVTLYAGGYPTNLVNGNPTFNPPSITTSPGNKSTLNIATRVDTPPGTYALNISGQDNCGGSPSGGAGAFTLTVTAPAAPSPTPTATASGKPAVSSASASSICAGAPATITVSGSNFVSGATVSAGITAATTVTVASSAQLTAAFPALAAGTYDITVTVPGGASGALFNALTVAASCASPAPVIGSTACAAGGGRYQTVVTITFYEPLIAGVTSATPYLTVTARQVALCQ
ncbi:MAG: hypothetical protein NVS3B24_20740 [Candidatus Dormibacteria bacterium]